MNANIFIDSNIFIYALLEGIADNYKHEKTKELIKNLSDETFVTSVQVISEIFNTLSRKYALPRQEIISKLKLISEVASVKSITYKTVQNAST